MLFKVYAAAHVQVETSPVMWHVSDSALIGSGFVALVKAFNVYDPIEGGIPTSLERFVLERICESEERSENLSWDSIAMHVTLRPGEFLRLAHTPHNQKGATMQSLELQRSPQPKAGPIMESRHAVIPFGSTSTQSASYILPDLGDDDPITIQVYPTPFALANQAHSTRLREEFWNEKVEQRVPHDDRARRKSVSAHITQPNSYYPLDYSVAGTHHRGQEHFRTPTRHETVHGLNQDPAYEEAVPQSYTRIHNVSAISCTPVAHDQMYSQRCPVPNNTLAVYSQHEPAARGIGKCCNRCGAGLLGRHCHMCGQSCP